MKKSQDYFSIVLKIVKNKNLKKFAHNGEGDVHDPHPKNVPCYFSYGLDIS
jgi:hypothetical protein